MFSGIARDVLKQALVVVLIATLMGALLLASYLLPIQGVWLDQAVSAYLTGKINQPVLLVDVKITHWSRMRFGLLTISTHAKKTLIVAGDCTLEWPVAALWKKNFGQIRLRLNHVTLLEDLGKKIPILAWASKEVFSDPILVKRLEVVARFRTNELLRAHLIRFDSDDIFLNGGMEAQNSKILKADVFLLLPSDRFEKVPRELRARMIKRKDGWRGIRLVFYGHSLVAIGSNGPFFEARWQ